MRASGDQGRRAMEAPPRYLPRLLPGSCPQAYMFSFSWRGGLGLSPSSSWEVS